MQTTNDSARNSRNRRHNCTPRHTAACCPATMAAADAYTDDVEPYTAATASGIAASSASASGSTASAGYEDVDISEIEIGKKLGGGGFAVVFLARFRGKRVAAKVLVDPKISDALRKEFMDELHVMR